MRVLVFSTNVSVAFLILRRPEGDITINTNRQSCKTTIFVLDFNEF